MIVIAIHIPTFNGGGSGIRMDDDVVPTHYWMSSSSSPSLSNESYKECPLPNGFQINNVDDISSLILLSVEKESSLLQLSKQPPHSSSSTTTSSDNVVVATADNKSDVVVVVVASKNGGTITTSSVQEVIDKKIKQTEESSSTTLSSSPKIYVINETIAAINNVYKNKNSSNGAIDDFEEEVGYLVVNVKQHQPPSSFAIELSMATVEVGIYDTLWTETILNTITGCGDNDRLLFSKLIALLEDKFAGILPSNLKSVIYVMSPSSSRTKNDNDDDDATEVLLIIDKISSYLQSSTMFKNSINTVQHHLYDSSSASKSTTKMQYYNQFTLNGAIQFGVINSQKLNQMLHQLPLIDTLLFDYGIEDINGMMRVILRKDTKIISSINTVRCKAIKSSPSSKSMNSSELRVVVGLRPFNNYLQHRIVLNDKYDDDDNDNELDEIDVTFEIDNQSHNLNVIVYDCTNKKILKSISNIEMTMPFGRLTQERYDNLVQDAKSNYEKDIKQVQELEKKRKFKEKDGDVQQNTSTTGIIILPTTIASSSSS